MEPTGENQRIAELYDICLSRNSVDEGWIVRDMTPRPLEIVTEVLKALFQEVLRLLDPKYVGRKLCWNVRNPQSGTSYKSCIFCETFKLEAIREI
jgi:hypothetical protein